MRRACLFAATASSITSSCAPIAPIAHSGAPSLTGKKATSSPSSSSVSLQLQTQLISFLRAPTTTSSSVTFRLTSSSSSSGGLHHQHTCRRSFVSSGDEGGGDFDFSYTPDLMSEAKELSKAEVVERILADWLPIYSNDDIRNKLRKQLTANPVNEMITNAEIQITHVENEQGEEVKFQLGAMSLQDALAQARDNERDLVQLASNNGKSFCRLRREKKRFLESVKEELEALEAAMSGKGGRGGDAHRKKKALNQHIFKDVVDAHFIGWKSAKIFGEIRAGHPIKLSIQQFQSPERAVAKMQEMLAAIKTKADAAAASNTDPTKASPGLHFYSGIGVSPAELSITLQPVTDAASKVKQTRHPQPKEWSQTEQRLAGLTGGKGTYRKSNVLVAKNVGAREFRTDKYGRRME